MERKPYATITGPLSNEAREELLKRIKANNYKVSKKSN